MPKNMGKMPMRLMGETPMLRRMAFFNGLLEKRLLEATVSTGRGDLGELGSAPSTGTTVGIARWASEANRLAGKYPGAFRFPGMVFGLESAIGCPLRRQASWI
jgi:hypothetical protein